MTHEDIAKKVRDAKEKIVLIYAFNATGKTRLSLAYKDATKAKDGRHAGVYYNAFSEDLFVWDNDGVLLDIRESSLNRFHGSLSEDDIREKLNRYRPSYRFEFIPYPDPEDGIKSVLFFYEKAAENDPSNISKVPIKISRGEERVFVWCFFLALFEVEGWADKQSSHFFIDDPVSSLDDHNIFITASTLFDLIEEHSEKRKFIITTHHIGLFSILADWLTKGDKAGSFKKRTKLYTLNKVDGEPLLENCENSVFLYHLRLLQQLDHAHANNAVKSFHFALLRQVLENVASFLGVSQFGYVLEQVGITDPEEAANIINTLSHKKVYYFESDELTPDSKALFENVFTRIKAKYNFVLHTPATTAPAPAAAEAPSSAPMAALVKSAS
ncbi:AAA family ATPase [Opitutus terrae]|uniref:Anticodon nuclease n=1 Tax=Opitutus terrae (strain DSM 11246 / JCM 15787 / PB90-1) TaxID=452637 RepID=B1ZMM9_OPITP|nr:AAA family ATPase [Opitutus terrae]ACB74374.1 anticodon nuclease [Opitutus terrae PB90-1]